MIILSFDPGLERTGYAVFRTNLKSTKEFKLLSSGLIKTEKKYYKHFRLFKIYSQIVSLVKKFKPDIVVFEEIFFFKNKKTIISVVQAQGVILLVAAQFNLKISCLSPLQIKQIVTGYGLSDKKNIKKMIDLTLKINDLKIGDDEYDAIACGLAYCFQNNILLK